MIATTNTNETTEESPLYTLDNVTLTTTDSTPQTNGVLTLTKSSLRWQKLEFQHEFSWLNIMLHAVVRKDVDHPRIFLQLDDNTEIHLTPHNDVCDEIFAAMCKAAEMNPDISDVTAEGNHDDDESDGVWFGGDNESKLAAYDQLLSMGNGSIVPGQFDDVTAETEGGD